MKLPLTWLFVVISVFLYTSVFGQQIDTTLQTKHTLEIPLFKKNVISESLSIGDSILLSFKEVNNYPIGRFQIASLSSPLIKEAKKITNYEELIILPQDETYELSFNRRLPLKKIFKKRKVHITFEKLTYIPPVKVNDFVEHDTIFYYDTTQQLVFSDTTFEKLFDGQNYVASVIEPGKKTTVSFEVNPLEDADFYVFWIGVGKEAFETYETLGSNMPPIWSEVGITEAVEAYGVGKMKQLPNNKKGEDVLFAFTNKTNEARFRQKKSYSAIYPKQKAKVAYGKIPAYQIPSDAPFYICLHNDNQVSGINVYAKVLAVMVDNEYEEVITDSMVVVRNVFKLNVNDLSTAEAKLQVLQTQKELDAAWLRTEAEFAEAYRLLDSMKTMRFMELKKAQENIYTAIDDLERKETELDSLTQVEIRNRIKGLENSSLDSSDVNLLRSEMMELLKELKAAKEELQELRETTKTLKDDLGQENSSDSEPDLMEEIIEETEMDLKKKAKKVPKQIINEATKAGKKKANEVMKKGGG